VVASPPDDRRNGSVQAELPQISRLQRHPPSVIGYVRCQRNVPMPTHTLRICGFPLPHEIDFELPMGSSAQNRRRASYLPVTPPLTLHQNHTQVSF
jgi:hypothetical protein